MINWKHVSGGLALALVIVLYDAYLSGPKNYDQCVMKEMRGQEPGARNSVYSECRRRFP